MTILATYGCIRSDAGILCRPQRQKPAASRTLKCVSAPQAAELEEFLFGTKEDPTALFEREKEEGEETVAELIKQAGGGLPGLAGCRLLTSSATYGACAACVQTRVVHGVGSYDNLGFWHGLRSTAKT